MVMMRCFVSGLFGDGRGSEQAVLRIGFRLHRDGFIGSVERGAMVGGIERDVAISVVLKLNNDKRKEG